MGVRETKDVTVTETIVLGRKVHGNLENPKNWHLCKIYEALFTRASSYRAAGKEKARKGGTLALVELSEEETRKRGQWS